MDQPTEPDRPVAAGGPNSFDARPSGLGDLVDDALVRVEQLRARVPIALIAAVGVGVAVAALWFALGAPGESSGPPIEDRIPIVALQTTVPVGAETGHASIVVHVAGAVATPGVYVLEADDRVIDAVTAAGGPLPDADLSMVNLAAPLIDGVQVRVPAMGEIVGPLPGATAAGPSGPIDLNRATADAFEALPGIGPATAAAIVEWRDRNGPFVTVEQLLDVPGIGPAKFERIVDDVVVG
jgi:competence protein ComEA